MTEKGKCAKCGRRWYVCDNCKAAGCGNDTCNNYQWKNAYSWLDSLKCKTCEKR